MRKILCTLFFAILFSFSHICAQQSTALAVYENGGTVTRFLLRERPVVTYNADGLTVASSALTMSFVYSYIRHFIFEDVADAIDAITVLSPEIVRDGDFLYLSGYKGCSQVRLYSLDGRLADVVQITSDGDASVSLQELSTGVYILAVGGKSYKIYRK